MESAVATPFGWTLGGPDAGRVPAARERLLDDGFQIPLEELAALGRRELQADERLPPIYAEPLMLQATQGLTQRHIADLLDVPETTIETRLARGRRMLRQLASERDAASGGHSTPSASARTATERTHAP